MRTGSWRTAVAVTVIVAMSTASHAVADTQAPTPQTTPATVKAGDVVPAFDAVGIDGTRKHIDYPKGTATVIVFFLSSCAACHKMIPEWNRAFEKRAKTVNIVGVMLDREVPGFFETNRILFPVLRAPTGVEFRNQFKIGKVPLTVRVGEGGKVQDAAMGVIDPIRVGQLFRP